MRRPFRRFLNMYGFSWVFRAKRGKKKKENNSSHRAVMMGIQVILGGGQDAADVTVTSSRAGGFQSFLFHKVTCLLRPLSAAEG